jgi:hypothetical protein
MILTVFTPSASALTYSGSSSYKSGKYYKQLTNIALTGDQRKDIVAIAQSQIGYQEGGSSSQLSGTVKGSGNYTEYGRWYGMQDMWCAMFVSWCAYVAGVPTSVVPSHSYTPTGLNWFIDRGRAYSRATVANGGYTPQPGDIIYFKSSRNQNITNHVGIVTGYSDGTVYTIEGNTSSATISTNGGAVCAKSYSISNTYIRYICCPNYTVPAVEETPPVDPWRDVVFDASFYADKYSDAKASCGSDFDALYQHFKTYGIKEGRQASPNFDLTYYLANNPGVQQSIGSATNYQAAYDYFVTSGYLDVNAKTAAPVDIGDHFYARIQMTPGKNLSLMDNDVILYSASEMPAQIWEFTRQSDGSYKIVNAKYSLCLSVQDAARTSGANVHTAKGIGGSHQSWFIYSYKGRYMLRPANSAYCALDVYGGYTDDLTNIEIYAANRSAAQLFDICKFDYTGAEYAVDLGQDLYVKISNAASGTYLTNASKNVTCAPDTDSAISVWRLIHQDDGSYRIIGQNTRLDMIAQGGADGDGVNVEMEYDYDAGLSYQRWYIYRCHHGYTLRAAHSSATRLAVESVSPTGSVNVQLGTVAGDDKQIFNITEIDYLEEVTPDNLGDDFYAKVRYYAGGTYMSLSNVNVITYSKSDSNAQLWRFIRQNNGSYKIVNQKTGMLLDALDTSAGDGVNVRTRTKEFAITSGWYLYKVGGLYALRCADTEDLMVTVEGGDAEPETNIHLGTFTGQTAQRFALEITDFYDAVKPIDLGDVFYSKITNIASGKNVSLNTDGGVNVVLNANSDAANQTWKFVRQSDGSYEIINQGNGFLLNTSGGSSEPGTNINTRGDENLTQQRWFIYLKEGNYILQPACASGCLLTVAGGSYADGTNVQNEAAAFSEAQMFSIISNVCGEAAVNSVGVTDEQMEVLRKIMYAVETGGQVYGNADYADFTEAYTNTSQEHAITIGAGQWYGPEAKTLLNRIRSADPALFASLDTAGVAADLDSSDWSSYSISKTSAKAKCIVSIISTDVGKAMQDQLIDEQMIKFMQEAKNLGVTDINALMMCANIRHLGGLSALKRILNKTATPYTLENICVGMSTDTGNQVGAPLFQSRHDFVVKYLNKYIPAEPVAAEHSFGYIKVESYATCGSAGLTFYLCNNCNMVKKEITPPTGDHAWVNATCTVAKTCSTCGLTEGAALGHSHKAVVTAPTCNDGGYTTYTCVCGDSYIADQVSARGHSYVDGICVNCGVVDPDYVAPVVVPTLTGAGFSLSFESEILVNFYYTATNTDDVMEQGMLVFYTDPTSADIAKADDVYIGSAVSGSYFVNTTRGIAAKEMGDSRYYCAFAKLSDGTYAYSPLCQYSPKKYATNMLANGTASAGQKALCVAMLNYGAAA